MAVKLRLNMNESNYRTLQLQRAFKYFQYIDRQIDISKHVLVFINREWKNIIIYTRHDRQER